MTTDPIQVRKMLEKQLKFDEVLLKKFIKGMNEHISTQDELRKSLFPTTSHFLKGDVLKPCTDMNKNK